MRYRNLVLCCRQGIQELLGIGTVFFDKPEEYQFFVIVQCKDGTHLAGTEVNQVAVPLLFTEVLIIVSIQNTVIDILCLAHQFNLYREHRIVRGLVGPSRIQRLKNEHYRLEQENIAIDIKRKEEIILMKQLEQHQHQLFIDELIHRLAETNQKALSTEVKKELFQVIRQLNDKVTNNDWNEVEKTMNVNHLTFFENLVKAYPNLTPNERRLCTLMHLNMSTKEISNITHQSINSINTARTRLRKKFNLSGDDTSLVAFLDQFDTKKETNF